MKTSKRPDGCLPDYPCFAFPSEEESCSLPLSCFKHLLLVICDDFRKESFFFFSCCVKMCNPVHMLSVFCTWNLEIFYDIVESSNHSLFFICGWLYYIQYILKVLIMCTHQISGRSVLFYLTLQSYRRRCCLSLRLLLGLFRYV